MATLLTYQAPCVKMEKLENLWFQLSTIACNLKCKHCYLSCTPDNKKKNFLGLDKVKGALEDTKQLKLKSIYLNGGEPLLHPDFNAITRLSLKRANVCVLSNGTLINDKKAKFLRQIENDHEYELIFRISLDHYTEAKNDEIRGKGSFKKALNGINNLVRHGFNPVISAVNLWNEDEEIMRQNYYTLMKKFDFEMEDVNLKIFPHVKLGECAKNYGRYSDEELVTAADVTKNTRLSKFDCANSRVVASTGVHSCPVLVNDPRSKVGNTISDCSSRVYLETGACKTCVNKNGCMMCNEW